MNRYRILLLSAILCNFALSDRCCEINYRELPQYELIHRNARSNQVVISRKNVLTPSECKKFASSKKALAFNYGFDYKNTGRAMHSNPSMRNSIRHSCQVLECPEAENFTSLVPDKNYKYYSMYPSLNVSGIGISTCIPKVGLFIMSSRTMNYSQARAVCQEVNGSLAHIASEERTNGLAKLVPIEAPVFVGLSNQDSERIWKNEYDEPLSCFDYRAWGKGQPAHSKGCVGLVQPSKAYSPPSWSVVPCFVEFPFICEITPTYTFNHMHSYSNRHNNFNELV